MRYHREIPYMEVSGDILVHATASEFSKIKFSQSQIFRLRIWKYRDETNGLSENSHSENDTKLILLVIWLV